MKKNKNKLMLGSLLMASSIIMVACTEEGTKEVIKEENKSETIVEKLQLTQDELYKAKLQQENRMVLLEHFTNTALSSNVYYVSMENLTNESLIPSTSLSKYEKDLQIALLNNSIDELNKILANQLTEKEVKLVEKLIDIKKIEIELIEVLYQSLEAGNFDKYVFTEELKISYEEKRNALVSFLLDSEKDITESVYLYHYPEINKDDIEKHIEFMNLIQGLTEDKTTYDLKDNIDYLLIEIASLTDVKKVNKETVLNILNKIEKVQNNAKLSNYYKENKFYKEFIDKYLEINIQEFKQSLEKDDFVDIYKKSQVIYTSLFDEVDEEHSYTYLYITSYYYDLKAAEEEKKAKEEAVKKANEEKIKEEAKKSEEKSDDTTPKNENEEKESESKNE